MKKTVTVLSAVVLLLGLSGVVGAATYTFQPTDPDLGDLDHNKYYTWGIDDLDLSEGEIIVGASLFFDDIRNHDSNPNSLWVHLLDTATDGVGTDYSGEGDHFEGEGTLLFKWEDLPTTPQDLTYTFSDSDIALLASYNIDGNFGFGFDPDCHFFNNGVTFSLESAPIPEPATVVLLGSGFLGILGLRRKVKRSE